MMPSQAEGARGTMIPWRQGAILLYPRRGCPSIGQKGTWSLVYSPATLCPSAPLTGMTVVCHHIWIFT